MGTLCSHQLPPISRGGHFQTTFRRPLSEMIARNNGKLIHHTNDREEVRFGSCVRFLSAFSYVVIIFRNPPRAFCRASCPHHITILLKPSLSFLFTSTSPSTALTMPPARRSQGRGRSASTPRQPLSSVGGNTARAAPSTRRSASTSTRPRSRSYSTKNGKGRASVTSALDVSSDHSLYLCWRSSYAFAAILCIGFASPWITSVLASPRITSVLEKHRSR